MSIIQETYHISRESMNALYKRLSSPSREQLLMREASMKRLQSKTRSMISGDTEIEYFEDLDLSFLKTSSFDYSEILIPENSSSLEITINQPIFSEPDTSYQGKPLLTTAA